MLNIKREKVDVESWKRRGVFNFFKDFINPQFSATALVECTGAYIRAKERGESFFLHYLYAILRAINEIEEFRYRVERESEDAEICVMKYQSINVTTPINVGSNGEYVEVYIPYNKDFNTFYRDASNLIENVKVDGEPFEANNSNGLGLCCVSAIPSLRFTSFSSTLSRIGAVNMMPLLAVGKMVEKDGIRTIPIFIQVHHGIADGKHVSDLYKMVEDYLK